MSFPCSLYNLVSTVDGLFSWGYNYYGQLGLGNDNNQNIPQKIESIDNSNDPILIGCGFAHSIVSTNEGIFSFGYNIYGQLGLGHNSNQNKPSKIELSNQQVISISCGNYHSMILTSDGIFSWGLNDHGQLGLGHNNNENKPQKISTKEKEVTSISCGCNYSMMLTSDGKLSSWGWNNKGQLGLGHNSDQNLPQEVEISSSSKVRSIVCGGLHSMILTFDRSLFSWGYNSNGQLGLGHNNNFQNKPCLIQYEFGEIVSIGCGYSYSMVLTSDGIFSWGCNTYGQLGLGHNYDENKPKRMEWNNIDIFTSVHCCCSHSIIFGSEGVFSWGDNAFGQLGNGNNSPLLTPQLIMNLSDMKSRESALFGLESYPIVSNSDISRDF